MAQSPEVLKAKRKKYGTYGGGYGEGRGYEPQKLNARHHEILRLTLLGYSDKEISEKLGCTKMAVVTARNCKLGQQYYNMLRVAADFHAVETAKRIRELAPKALEAIREIMDDESMPANTRLNAAKDILDRAGFAAPKQVQVQSTSLNLSPDDITNLKEEAIQRAMINGYLVDVPAITESSSNSSSPLEGSDKEA